MEETTIRRWGLEEDAELIAAYEKKEPPASIAKRLGRTRDAVVKRMSKLRKKQWNAQVADEAGDMEKGALRAELDAAREEIKRLRAGPAEERAPVESFAAPHAIPAEELWRTAEEENERWITRARQQGRFRVRFDDGPVGVTVVADQHIAPRNVVDLRRMREDAELIAATRGLYCVLGGDAVDNHIKHLTAILAARSQPSDQWQLFEYYLTILAPSVLCCLCGNHDIWTNQYAGVDVLRQLVERQKLCYSPHEARLEVIVGDQPYKVAVRHRYRYNSSLNMCHTVKRWWAMGGEPFDIGSIAHHHEASAEMFMAHGFKRYACRPGSYQIMSDFAMERGYNESYPTCPTFILYPGERRIVAYDDLREGVRRLELEKGA